VTGSAKLFLSLAQEACIYSTLALALLFFSSSFFFSLESCIIHESIDLLLP
jgi:hypothetical protein